MAIKVIKENPVPRQEVTCVSCGSILEYGNADLEIGQRYSDGFIATYIIKCPVCGVSIRCEWIKKK